MSAHVSFDQEIPGFQAPSANALISLPAVKPVAFAALRFAWCVNTVGTLQTIGQRALPCLVPVGLVLLWQLASSQGWLSTRVQTADQVFGSLPGLVVSFPHDHIQTNAKADSAAVASCSGAYISYFFSNFGGRLIPGQIGVYLLGRHLMRCFGRPAEIDRQVGPLNGRVQQLLKIPHSLPAWSGRHW